MDLKGFFKPTITKFILTIILTILFYFHWLSSLAIACPEMVGYDCTKEFQEARMRVAIGSIIFTIVWYIVACIIISVIKKFKNKNSSN